MGWVRMEGTDIFGGEDVCMEGYFIFFRRMRERLLLMVLLCDDASSL